MEKEEVKEEKQEEAKEVKRRQRKGWRKQKKISKNKYSNMKFVPGRDSYRLIRIQFSLDSSTFYTRTWAPGVCCGHAHC